MTIIPTQTDRQLFCDHFFLFTIYSMVQLPGLVLVDIFMQIQVKFKKK